MESITSTEQTSAPICETTTPPVSNNDSAIKVSGEPLAIVVGPCTDNFEEDDSLLTFDYPSSDTTSTWTDSINTSVLSWSSNTTCSPIQESNTKLCQDQNMDGIPGTSNLGTDHRNLDTMKSDIYLDISECGPIPGQQTLELDNSWPNSGDPEPPIPVSEDPFMGWASKRASHLFDDYGWVLSHVEAL